MAHSHSVPIPRTFRGFCKMQGPHTLPEQQRTELGQEQLWQQGQGQQTAHCGNGMRHCSPEHYAGAWSYCLCDFCLLQKSLGQDGEDGDGRESCRGSCLRSAPPTALPFTDPEGQGGPQTHSTSGSHMPESPECSTCSEN